MVINKFIYSAVLVALTLEFTASYSSAVKFNILGPLEEFLGPNAKPFSATEEEIKIIDFCKEKGFSTYSDLGRHEHGYYVNCVLSKNSSPLNESTSLEP